MPEVFGPDELALLAAVHADPRNDAPRLRYADWLQGQGATDHAEFIRLQCQEPYVMVVNGHQRDAGLSTYHPFPWDDPTAIERRDRIIALLGIVYASDRYERQRKLRLYDEHDRGLPVIHAEEMDVRDMVADDIVTHFGHLCRVELTIRLEHHERLADWLAHPVMERVDRLRIQPTFDPESEPDEDHTLNSRYDAYWAEHIPMLAAWPHLDRLEELHPCGCHSTGTLTQQSEENIRLCQKLLEPRVYIEYSW